MAEPEPVTERLARFVAETRYEDLPESVLRGTRASIVDTLGVMVAGRALGRGVDEVIAAVRAESGPDGPCTVIGEPGGVHLRGAVLANGSMCHQLDFDDTHDSAVVHPTANSLPMALAIGERDGASGRDLIEAVAVGNEVACRLGKSLTKLMFEYPWVRPPVLGMFGGVAAGARMLGLDAEAVANAWGLLLPRVGGTLACLVEPGSWVRTMRDGFSGDSGALALTLAAAGVQGERRPFEGEHGLFEAYFRGDYEPGELLDGLGARWAAEEISIKPWPCCREVHCTLTALFDAMEEHGLRGGQIDRVLMRVGSTNLELCEPGDLRRHPKQATDALCNLPFNVAIGAVHGAVPVTAYSPEGLADPAVNAMADRVSWAVDPDQDRLGTLEPGSLVLTLQDGTEIETTADIARGHPERPLTDDQLARKYFACVVTLDSLAPAAGERLHGLLATLEGVADVQALTACLRRRRDIAA